MKLPQLSVFLENRPGSLAEPLRTLATAGINLVSISLADTEQFGILRLIVRDWKKAKAVFEEGGCVVNITEVVAIEVEDRPGGLLQVLQVIEECGVNVEYMYAFTFRKEDKAIIVFRFEDMDRAIKELAARGINLIGSVELFDRVQD
jgi:hypothetical protein